MRKRRMKIAALLLTFVMSVSLLANVINFSKRK